MMLALRMGRTLKELCQGMSSAEFSLWAEMYRLDEWGQKPTQERADYRAGLICATVANYAGMRRPEHAGQASPQDYMPFYKQPEPEEPDPVVFFTAVKNSKQSKPKE